MNGITVHTLTDLACRIRAEHAGFETTARRAFSHALEAGRLLAEAKRLLGYGRWLPWLESECGLPARTASHYMRLHRKIGAGQIGNVADLTQRAAMRLLAPAEAAHDERKEKLAASRFKRLARIGEAARLEDQGRFAVIVSDPPYQYDFSLDSADAIDAHYPPMSIAEICALPVPQIAHDDCIMFTYVTAPKLKEYFEVIEAWEFEFKTQAVWDKGRSGMGFHFRVQHENLMVATRGEMPVPPPELRGDSILRYPYRGHSVKPWEVLEIIERYYPDVPKIELFRRGEPRPGWSYWGNEVAAA